jgi:hypothetical protein
MISVEQLFGLETCKFPMVIPTYNNPTYLNNTISFWSKRGVDDFVILDNGSTYPQMLDLLNEIDAIVVSSPDNPGPRHFYENQIIYNWLPRNFIVTDPDLLFDPTITLDDVKKLIELTDHLSLFKLGSMLNLDMKTDNIVDSVYLWGGMPNTIRNLESQYYTNAIYVTEDNNIIYAAPVDTTFAVYNKDFDRGFFANNARIGKIYSAEHIGWYLNHPIPDEERAFYLESVSNVRHASNEVIRRGESW